MLNSFCIHNFKNFGDLTLSKLRRVNLIVGRNSIGKSTLLEALSLYLSDGDELNLRDTLKNRGENVESSWRNEDESIAKEHYLSLFKDWEENYSKSFYILIGETKEKSIRISQVFIDYVNDVETGNRKTKVFHQEDIQGEVVLTNDYSEGLHIKTEQDNRIIRYSRRGIGLPSPKKAFYQIVHTMDFNGSTNAILYDKISLSTLEDYIIRALNIINPSIEKIAFISEDGRMRERIPVVSLKGSNKRVRLSSMGDGINRILTIILSLLNAKDGYLLLDEFETGLHYSVQKQLWDIIFLLSNELNVQVFVTSHSTDCLRAFSQTNTEDNGMLIRLEQRKSGIVPVCYEDNDDILYAAENNIELR